MGALVGGEERSPTFETRLRREAIWGGLIKERGE